MAAPASDPSSRVEPPSAPAKDLPAIKRRLREALPHLREKYAVERLALHGSQVRGEAGPESDLDVLVDFADSEAGRAVSLLDFIALQQELEALLGLPVDLGERSTLDGPAGERIAAEAEPIT
jgi:hypothetical protein